MDIRDFHSHMRKWFEKIDKKRMLAWVNLEDLDVWFEEDNPEISEGLSRWFKDKVDDNYCVPIPIEFQLCDLCRGKGTHVNPSIDSNGITEEDWHDWDDDEKEGYFNGMYDVDCYCCGGEKVVPIISNCLSENEKELAMLIRNHQKILMEMACEDERNSRMGY